MLQVLARQALVDDLVGARHTFGTLDLDLRLRLGDGDALLGGLQLLLRGHRFLDGFFNGDQAIFCKIMD